MPSILDADSVLKLWAVLGPLLAAAGSAVWGRRIQLADRAHSDERENQRLDREAEERARASQESHALQEYLEAKSAISKFMASSYNFVNKQTHYRNNVGDPEAKRLAHQANEEFIQNGQLVILVADDELERSTIELWNHVLTIPRPAAQANGTEYEALLDAYKQARSRFNAQAKRFLKTLRNT